MFIKKSNYESLVNMNRDLLAKCKGNDKIIEHLRGAIATLKTENNSNEVKLKESDADMIALLTENDSLNEEIKLLKDKLEVRENFDESSNNEVFELHYLTGTI